MDKTKTLDVRLQTKTKKLDNNKTTQIKGCEG